MDNPTILVLADMGPAPGALAILQGAGTVICADPDPEAVARELPRCDACLTSLYVRLTDELLAGAGKLKAIATPSTGTDHIDLEAAARRGVEVICIKHDRDFLDRVTATAEMAWGLLLACVRKLPAAFDSAKKGVWARDEFRGMQLAEKTLGIVGFGRLGTMVADYARAFRMKVIACDVRDLAGEDVEQVDFDTLMREADVISLHVHLDESTTGLIDGAALAKMKRGVVIVNTSRGAVIDEEARWSHGE